MKNPQHCQKVLCVHEGTFSTCNFVVNLICLHFRLIYFVCVCVVKIKIILASLPGLISAINISEL